MSTSDIDLARFLDLPDPKAFKRARTAQFLEDAITERTGVSPVIRASQDGDVIQVLLSEKDATNLATFLMTAKNESRK